MPLNPRVHRARRGLKRSNCVSASRHEQRLVEVPATADLDLAAILCLSLTISSATLPLPAELWLYRATNLGLVWRSIAIWSAGSRTSSTFDR